ncbi:MAG: hypothetical protein LBT07_00545, partial [Endomicrobium sp.]|nr:hypothetical protein [Endomicrobium sp.]
MSKIMVEKSIKKNQIYHGSAVDFFCDEVELLNGAAAKREYVQHPGASAVIPFIDKNNIVLV